MGIKNYFFIVSFMLLTAAMTNCTDFDSNSKEKDTSTEAGGGNDTNAEAQKGDNPSPDAQEGSIADDTSASTDQSEPDPDDTDYNDTDEPVTGTSTNTDEETCSESGLYRCVDGTLMEREECKDGKWVKAEPCKEGEVCDTEEDPGSCIETTAVCKDRTGEMICDGDVMHTCGDQGVSVEQERCKSNKHCQAGLDQKECAVCVDGEYECEEESLFECRSPGMNFKLKDTCETEALCNAETGRCSDVFCEPDDYFCDDNNKLLKCNEGQTAWEEVKQCKPQPEEFCDAEDGECDKCLPKDEKETRTCSPADANTVLVCSKDGQELEEEKCTDTAPLCRTEDAECVECFTEEDCTGELGPCEIWTCTDDNECEKEDIKKGDPCANGEVGVCESKGGECVQCIDNNNCSGLTPVCDEDNNTCVGCLKNSDCIGDGVGMACSNNMCLQAYQACSRYLPCLNFLQSCQEGYCVSSCNSNWCIPGALTSDASLDAECTTRPNAGENETTKYCFFGCSSKEDCPSGLKCNSTKGICVK